MVYDVLSVLAILGLTLRLWRVERNLRERSIQYENERVTSKALLEQLFMERACTSVSVLNARAVSEALDFCRYNTREVLINTAFRKSPVGAAPSSLSEVLR